MLIGVSNADRGPIDDALLDEAMKAQRAVHHTNSDGNPKQRILSRATASHQIYVKVMYYYHVLNTLLIYTIWQLVAIATVQSDKKVADDHVLVIKLFPYK